MEPSQKSPSRKKFLLWGAAALCSATVLKFIPGTKKKNNNTVRMLTQDGKLVEIDKELLKASGKKLLAPGEKITEAELKQWVKNKTIQ